MTSEYTGSGHAKRFSLTRHWSDKSELLWEKRFSLTGIGLRNLNCFEIFPKGGDRMRGRVKELSKWIAKGKCPQVLPGCKNVEELLSAERVCKLVNNNDANKQYKHCFPKNIIKWKTQEIFWCVN